MERENADRTCRGMLISLGGNPQPVLYMLSQQQTVEWRLVTGLGSAGVLEGSGMTLHRLYGFPYLPGSGLKGLVRHYLWLDERRGDADPLITRILGSPGQRGEVIFWDAWPEVWPILEVDIINVHFQEYYAQDWGHSQPVPPADYLSPN
jgi:CRISPR-associated protein Cmr6